VPQLFSGGSWPAPASRTSVSSNSVTVITPGTGSSTTSTIVVSTTWVIGGFIGLAFLRATFFRPPRLALATTLVDFDFLAVRLAAVRRTDLEDLRALPRTVDFFYGNPLFAFSHDARLFWSASTRYRVSTFR
jgi:hypothetical protein